MTFKRDLDNVKANQQTKCLGPRSSKVITAHRHTDTHTLDQLLYLDHKTVVDKNWSQQIQTDTA